MMRLLSRPGMGHGPFAGPRLGNPFLGQDIGDLLDVDALSTELVDLMSRLPDNLLGQYRTRYDECQRRLSSGGVVGLYQGGRCLKNLYEDVRESLRQEGTRSPAPPGTRPPEGGGFPWLIVGGVAAVGVGVAIYFVARR